jgi:hypothetical protein
MDINSFQAGVTIGLNVSSGVTGGVLAAAGWGGVAAGGAGLDVFVPGGFEGLLSE